MRMRFAASTFALAVLASACADTRGLQGTDVGQQSPEIRASGPEEYFAAKVLKFIQGMDQAEAIQTLESDGATCAESTCTYSFVWRETWYEMTFGLRMPGPRRSWLRAYTVTFLNDPILERQDIDVAYRSTAIE